MATRKPLLLSIQPVSDGGGSEHALIGMIRQLNDAGWACHVAIPSPARLAEAYVAAGATLHVVPMRRLTTSGSALRWAAYALSWPATVGRLAVLARRLGATVVHTNSLHSWYGWAVAGLVRRPHVWHAREIVVQSRAALRVERALTRRCAAAVFAISGPVAAQLAETNVVVVRDEPDPERFRPDRAGLFRARVGIADDVPLVGSVARIDTWKGFDILLDALPALQAARPGLEVVVAGAPVGGKDAYATALAARAARLPGVHWLGPRDDVAELMADLDVFVQVSTEPEPYGLVLVEALAAGVPVVAGDRGGPVEILEGLPRHAGRLVPPGDPTALAEAVLALMGSERSSSAGRRARPRQRDPDPPGFVDLFEGVQARWRGGAGWARRGGGTASAPRHR